MLSSSSRLGLRTSLGKNWALCIMIRVGNTCLGSLRLSALIMASRDSTVLRIALSRMVLQKGPIGCWKKVSSPCYMSLACLHHSGKKLWHHLYILTTELSLLLCQTVHLMKHSLGGNLISLCYTFGAVLLMSWFRRTSDLLGVLDHT